MRFAARMLGRLMFLYFLQSKGFLDDDPHFLRRHLRATTRRTSGLCGPRYPALRRSIAAFPATLRETAAAEALPRLRISDLGYQISNLTQMYRIDRMKGLLLDPNHPVYPVHPCSVRTPQSAFRVPCPGRGVRAALRLLRRLPVDLRGAGPV